MNPRDLEKTMQFITGSLAKSQAWMDRAEVRARRQEERVAKMEARLDKRINAITRLIQAGMQTLERQRADFDCRMNALIASQQRTEQQMQVSWASLRKGRDGH